MGQFKPMVKMMTTEPSVELKLKKGGKVEKKMQMGGALAPTATPAPAGMPARGGTMPAATPMRPSLAARRRMMRGMPTGAAPAAPVGRAAAMMKKGGETAKEHKAEMAKMSKTEQKLKEHAAKPASKAHKGLKTGGVVNGQGGYKTGGVVMGQGGYKTGGVVMGQGGYKKGGKVKMAKGGAYCAEGGIITEEEGSKDAGEYKDTKMVTAAKGQGSVSDYERKTFEKSQKKYGLHPRMNLHSGDMEMVRPGGYKKGGAAKKYAKGGAVNDSGKAESMPQGHKKPSAPVSITQLSGTFKKGGAVMTPAEKRLHGHYEKENAPAMKDAKTKDVEVYSKYGKKMRSGGSVSDFERKVQEKTQGQGVKSDFERRMFQEMLDEIQKPVRRFADSVTETEKSVTVTPGKKRGGRVKC